MPFCLPSARQLGPCPKAKAEPAACPGAPVPLAAAAAPPAAATPAPPAADETPPAPPWPAVAAPATAPGEPAPSPGWPPLPDAFTLVPLLLDALPGSRATRRLIATTTMSVGP